MHQDIDLSGRQLRIRSPLGAPLYEPGHRNDIFTPEGLRRFMCLRAVPGVEHHLRLAIAIPHIDEDHSSQVAPNMNPPVQRNGLSYIRGAKFAAGMGALPCA